MHCALQRWITTNDGLKASSWQRYLFATFLFLKSLCLIGTHIVKFNLWTLRSLRAKKAKGEITGETEESEETEIIWHQKLIIFSLHCGFSNDNGDDTAKQRYQQFVIRLIETWCLQCWIFLQSLLFSLPTHFSEKSRYFDFCDLLQSGAGGIFTLEPTQPFPFICFLYIFWKNNVYLYWSLFDLTLLVRQFGHARGQDRPTV